MKSKYQHPELELIKEHQRNTNLRIISILLCVLFITLVNSSSRLSPYALGECLYVVKTWKYS